MRPSPEEAHGWLDKLALSQEAQRRILWGAIAAAGAALTIKWLGGSSSGPRSTKRTDFNSFLVNEKAAPQQEQSSKSKLRQPAADSFDAFLIESKPKPPATSFDAFLKAQETPEPQLDNEGTAVSLQSGPRDNQVVVCVMFGTEYGFAQEIAGKLCDLLQEAGKYWPRLLNMADHPSGADLSQEQVLLAVCSTQGDGVPPSEARGFCDWLNSTAAVRLPATYYSVCALGDSSYTHFCACGKQIDARLASLESHQLVPRQDVNKEDWRAINSWLRHVVDSLDCLKLQTAAETGYVLEDGGGDKCAGISKARPFLATISAAEGLCHIGSAGDKDTIRIEIDLGASGLEYSPGDALGIYASNDPQVVEDLLKFSGADGEELIHLPAWHYADVARPAGSQLPLREALMHCFDLRSPKAALLQLLLDCLPVSELLSDGPQTAPLQNGNLANGSAAAPTGSKSHVNGKRLSERGLSVAKQAMRLKELLKSGEAALEAYFAPRHVVDVLEDFEGARPPLKELLSSLRALQPRLYSISSSPLEGASRAQITVATVRYSSLERERLGVASTFLADRIKVGQQLPVYISRNPDFRLPENPATPMIMVGPGTGLAPFRAFIMERILSGQASGPSLLFFGCRRRDQDYLYGEVLERWASEGRIELFTAFSREQGHKVYVQDRLREQGSRVWHLLQSGGHFYVCGDAAHMASAVEAALIDIIASHQGTGQDVAGKYLEDLQQEARYQRDVWF